MGHQGMGGFAELASIQGVRGFFDDGRPAWGMPNWVLSIPLYSPVEYSRE